jgi:cell wall-associated NlpC family hydrolase
MRASSVRPWQRVWADRTRRFARRAIPRGAVIAVLTLAAAGCATRPLGSGAASGAGNTTGPGNATAPIPSQSVNAASRGALLAERARAMVGQPYRFGGAAPGGFDCSGLVVYAAQGAGIVLPRTALEQKTIGLPVPRGALQPGDLVFMHLSAKELHVGIAIDAKRFVHAPSAGHRVRIDSLDAVPYSTGFMAARRIVFQP